MVTRLVKFAAFGELFIHLPSEAAVVTRFRFRFTRKRFAHSVDASIWIAADDVANDDSEGVTGAVFSARESVNSFAHVLKRQ